MEGGFREWERGIMQTVSLLLFLFQPITCPSFPEPVQLTSSYPEDFNVHKSLVKILAARKSSVENGECTMAAALVSVLLVVWVCGWVSASLRVLASPYPPCQYILPFRIKTHRDTHADTGTHTQTHTHTHTHFLRGVQARALTGRPLRRLRLGRCCLRTTPCD